VSGYFHRMHPVAEIVAIGALVDHSNVEAGASLPIPKI